MISRNRQLRIRRAAEELDLMFDYLLRTDDPTLVRLLDRLNKDEVTKFQETLRRLTEIAKVTPKNSEV